jgi:Ni/Fe-hydrogenase subunit HybB-like protein
MSDRLTNLKTILWTLVGVLAAVSVVRFTRGLGSVTNLSDAAPWGLWIGFDVMSGVALAAGGFVLAATVHIFGMKRYHGFLRPAILTAWLGYAAVAVGLLYDLGLPWRIWHPILHWQHRSVLFEVALCVMLYLSVLTLEFAPAILEHPLLDRRFLRGILRILKKATIPLVIAGIVLSTLHQSSLGSLFLITPYRLHPLWYSHIIYVLFFVSAVALGLMMVVLESLLSAYFFRHEVHTRELAGLGLAASVVLWIYVALRLGDLALRGVLGMAVDGSWHGALFVAELGLSAVIPATLMLSRRVRESRAGMAVAAAFTVSGMVLYRLDVSIFAFLRPPGFGYHPSWEELAVSVGIVSAFALLFIFFVERLKVYEDVSRRPRSEDEPKPSYDPSTVRRLQPRTLAAPGRFTGAALAGAAVALLFLPVRGSERTPSPVVAARSVEGESLDRGPARTHALAFAALDSAEAVARARTAALPGMTGRSTGAFPGSRAPLEKTTLLLLIDGNRDGYAVLFDHEAHKERLGGDTSCVMCHHLNLPPEANTPCASCHRDMYDSTQVFDHAQHIAALDGNEGCVQCHAQGVKVKSYATSTACSKCHVEPVVTDPVIPAAPDRWPKAEGYMDAMHGLCVACHKREVQRHPDKYPADLAECGTCHDADRAAQLRELEPARDRAVLSRPPDGLPAAGRDARTGDAGPDSHSTPAASATGAFPGAGGRQTP